MAFQSGDPSTVPTAQFVANAFVEQYYHILHHSPEQVFRFYQESSVLSRQEESGEITSVTTMQGINEKILSMDYKNYKAEIKTADAQESYKEGVIVLVTGCLTGKDRLRRKFAQSFFLAPQVKGYYVLNDVFRYVDEGEQLNVLPECYAEDSQPAPLVVDPEPTVAPDHALPETATSNAENNQVHIEKESETLEVEISADTVNEVAPEPQLTENQVSVSASAEPSHSSTQEDAQKKSYASIVKVPKGSSVPTKVYVPTIVRAAATPAPSEKKPSSVPAAAASQASAQVSDRPAEGGDVHEEVEGYSIYVRNMPLNLTADELETEFKKFGPIKQGGVQVRSNWQMGTCYGFVEYLSSSSMESAIQASPILIGGRKAVVEMKRTTSRVEGGRGRFSSSRGGYRSDGFRGDGFQGDGFRNDGVRGRGGFSGGRGYGRSDYGGRGEYSSRGGGEYSSRGGRGPGRAGDGYQRGRVRSFLQSGPVRDAVA